jgi:hypothetical protein
MIKTRHDKNRKVVIYDKNRKVVRNDKKQEGGKL